MLFQGDSPHPAHRTFGDAIDCTYNHFETGDSLGSSGTERGGIPSRIRTAFSLPTRFDVIIAEGTAPLQTALAYGAVCNPDALVLYLGADETFYTLRNRRTRYVWRALRPISNRILTGSIVISDLVYEWGRPYLGQLPYEIVAPPIPADRYDRLKGIAVASPASPFRVLSVGAARRNKNHGELVSAVETLRNRIDTEAELVLVGEGHDKVDYGREWVSTPGFVSVEEFIRLHKTASVYVQPSSADGYGIAVVEAMLGGTPTVATEMVGAANRLSKNHVCRPTADDIAERLWWVFEQPVERRVDIGHTHRDAVLDLTEANQAGAFRGAVKRLVGNTQA